MTEKVKTSVIGSYPIHIDTTVLTQKYFSKQKITWTQYIAQAAQDMTRAGIDIISDGQTRDPFIQLFTRKLRGCRIRDRTEIIGEIAYNNPITVSDQIYLRQLLPKKTELLGIITGPFTLTKSSVDLFYHDEKELAFAFASALRNEVKNLQKYVDIISIDEPFFSNELPEYANELISRIIKDLSCTTRLHVCGDVSNIIPQLIEMPVDILSHEFKASPHLFNVFQNYSSIKKICVGAVRSDDNRIEPIDEIVDHVKKAFSIFGDNIVQISPDCGQRLLPRDIAFHKLKNLVAAGVIINGG